MRYASVNKEFTAISILQLVEKKALNLSDDIREYIPDFPSQENKIMIQNLLTNTSGIKRHADISWAENEANKQFKNTIDVINYFKQNTLDFPPNTKHSYVNMNYVLLGHIIEKVSGKTYETYIIEHILQPLNMQEIFFLKDGQNIPGKPKGYEKENNKFVHNRPHLVNPKDLVPFKLPQKTWQNGTMGLLPLKLFLKNHCTKPGCYIK